MGFWDRLRQELIDIIEWSEDDPSALVWKFPRFQNEIKNGAQLIVRPGQAAVFVDQGKVADVFGPGRYKLATENMPILATIKGWKYGFESPFKADVYFVSTRRFTDQKWGTKNPVMLRDAEFGPIRLRAFGTYAMQVTEPAKLVGEIAGAGAHFSVGGIVDQLRNIIVAKFTDVLGESKIPALDLAANYDELGAFLTDRIGPKVSEYGLQLTTLLVENISLPPQVEEALDKRSSMGVLGDLNKYTQFQTAEAIRAAADNPNGGAMGEGMGMGMGFAMAQQMANSLNRQHQQSGQAGASVAPPPLPGAVAVYLVINGQQAGPFNTDQLRAQAASGALTRSTLAWKAGMANWGPAGDLPEVAAALAAPPPVPGSGPGSTPPPPPPAS